MTLRVLKRKVIIREYDFNKIKESALNIGLYADNCALYDRVEFTPLDRDTLEKIQLQEILRGKHSAIAEVEVDLEKLARLLYQLKDHLYDEKYCVWNPSVDEDGYICVQARRNTPKTRLGWGVFEKDLVSRL